jgi:hypothetical protein
VRVKVSPKHEHRAELVPSIRIMRAMIAAATVVLVPLLAGCDGGPAAGTCEDQTSMDHNWDNDMLCKRSDGSTFETDYSGAEEFEANSE